MGFPFTSSTHSRYSSHTLFTAYTSRTHVKAPQTDFHIKPDNSSGLTHDSPSERLLRTKVTFQPKQAPKSSEESRGSTKRRDDHPSQARTYSAPCSARSGIGTKARRAASKPNPYPPRCSEPWKKLQIIRSDSMARHCRHRRLRSLVYRDRFPSLSLERKISSFFLSLCISSILSTSIPIYIYIELQFLQ